MKGFNVLILVRTTAKYYPSFWQAVNLIVLYTFLQSIIDFPLALIDYQNGTDWLQEPLLKLPVFFSTTIVILFLGTRYSGLPYRDIYPFRLFHWLNIPVILVTLFGLQFFMNEISMNVDKLLPPPTWFLELFNRIFESDFGIWGGIFRVVLLAPVVEELIFRGVIFSGFQRNYHAFWAIFLSALLFALFHLNPWQFGPTFLLGLILGWVRLRTGSLLAAIFTHALHNGMIFLIVYLKTEPTNYLLPANKVLGYLFCLTIVVVGAILIYYVNGKSRSSEKKSSDKLKWTT